MKSERVFRVGLGTDRHRLVPGRRFVLGGVEIPSETGEDGHSDGDVLLHAIADALLGAAALGDIGGLFPPGDPRWKDADSALLLAEVWRMVRRAGWQLENLDCVIHLEKPKFLPWRTEVIRSVRRILAEAGGIPEEGGVFVKAKTGEGLGEVGQGLVVEAQAVCLLSGTAADFSPAGADSVGADSVR